MRTRDFLSLIAWEVLNPVLLRAKRRRVYEFDPAWRGVNLGCGLDNAPEWVGVDGGITHLFMHRVPAVVTRRFFRGFRMAANFTFDDYVRKIRALRMIHHDLRFGIPFRDRTVPHIYSSHFFEHLQRDEARRLLGECYRVMKPGALIRIVVPSLESEVQKMRRDLDAYERGDIQAIQRWVSDARTGFFGPYSQHRWMYDVRELSDALARAGFGEIVERRFREGAIPDVEDLDTRPGIYLEARKAVAEKSAAAEVTSQEAQSRPEPASREAMPSHR